MNRDDLEKDAVRRIGILNSLREFDKTADAIIKRHCGDIDLDTVREVSYRAIFNRFFLYFCGMSAELQNECLVKLLDRHCPESAGELFDVDA